MRIRTLTYLRGEEMWLLVLCHCHRRRKGAAVERIEIRGREK